MAERVELSSGHTFDDLSSTAGIDDAGYDGDAVLFGETNVLNLEENQEGPQSAVQSNFKTNSSTSKKWVGDEEPDSPTKAAYSELPDEQDLSPDGVLDEDTIERGLSNLGRSAHGTEQVFLDLTLPGYCLCDITILNEYVHIQKVELPYNELTDLSPLTALPFLTQLDVAHNKLTTMNDFACLKSVKTADLSFNQIIDMVDLSNHHYLTSLKLDNNQIESIQGLKNCSRLKELSIGHNHIQEISGLDELPIAKLNLQYNQLKRISCLETLKLLLSVDFSGNQISSLSGLAGHDFLEFIDVENNQILDLNELDHVMDLKMLRDLNLKQNRVQEIADYRLSVIFRLQKLTELDRAKVEAEEKVAAVNLFNPSREVVAARDHIMHVVYSFLQPGKVMESTLPSMSTPYPMLVLVGPEGSGKADLAMKLVAEFPEYFGYGITHTTRKPYPHEVPDKHYHFVSLEEFEDEIRYGQFLYTYNYAGYWYGLGKESIESVARDGLACVVHMELEGVLTLKNTHFEPRYVFIMPITPQAHERRMRSRQLYSDPEVELALSRTEIYIEQNVENPGFFDMYINSDDIAEAYIRLRRLVLDYLGVADQSPEVTSQDPLTNQDAPPQSAGVVEIAKPWSQARKSTTGGEGNRGTDSPLNSKADVGTVEEASIQRRQSAAREAIIDCARPRTHDVVIHRATRSCIDRIRTSATQPESYTDSSSADSTNDSTGGTETFSESGAGSVNHDQTEYIVLTPKNSPDGSNKDGSEAYDVDDRPPSVNRPGSDKHPVLPPIQSPQPIA